MNEKEFQELLDLALDNRADRDKSKTLALAHIARQLTRIADAGDVVSAYLNIQANIELDKEMAGLPPRKPDALVEAVKHVIGRLNAGFTQKDAIFHLKRALADHEKAGG